MAKAPHAGVKQRRTRFVKEYLKDQNATKAAESAGYSAKTAYSQGARLLKDDEVMAAIELGNAKVNAKLDITVERVKEELARLAFFDVRAILNPDGSVKPFSELDEDSARAIAGFETAELFEGKGEDRNLAGYVKKFKLADKGANLERLGRHLQMFPTKVEFVGTITQKTEENDLRAELEQLKRDCGFTDASREAEANQRDSVRIGSPPDAQEDPSVLPR